MNQNLIYKIAITRIPNVGNVIAKNLISHCGSAEAVFKSSKKQLSKITRIGPGIVHNIIHANVEELAKNDVIQLEKSPDINLLFYTDKAFPQRLRNYEVTPLLLYVKGNADLNTLRTVAIIGTRNATEYGKLICEKLVEELKFYGVSVVSGLAYGIDGCAHRKSVEINIPNIAVLGSGIDRIYPGSHQHLAKRIVKNGALISQFPFGAQPDRENFPIRNHVVAGISDVVVVVQSQKSGGSMITAEIANNFNKDVFAFPGRIGDSKSDGCNALIKQHKAHLIESAKDIAYIMRWEAKERIDAQMKLFHELPTTLKEVMNVMNDNDTLDIDTLHGKLKRPLSQLSSDLLTLEFKGLIKSLPGKRYVRI